MRGKQERAGEGFGARRPQIEYKDEEPRIRALFEEECAKRGVKSNMAAVA